MTIILGLDISSVSTGYAIMTDGYLTAYGTIKFKSKKVHGERLGLFEKRLAEIINEYKPDIIGIEDVFAGKNIRTMKVLSLYHGIAYKTCWELTKAMPEVGTPSELRKRLQKATGVVLTGKRKKNKELVFNYIKEKFQLDHFSFKTSNDESDAIAVALATALVRKKTNEKSVRATRNSSGKQPRRSKKSV